MTLLDFPATDPGRREPHPGQWRLARLEVYNWGTFEGHHAIDVARTGHLLTGASGSGKSSLLDAIAAVLTPDKWLRFNFAAQEGGGRGDRSLVSYVRGAWSKEADETEDRAVSAYLRPGAVWSGILLRFDDLGERPVTLVRLFHLRGTSTELQDLRDASLITRDRAGLLDFADYARHGIEARALKAAANPVVVTTNRDHGAFYTRLRSLLGIANENALQLLHRTQAAKNLGSLDVLFRTFMLDEPATFARADSAVEQFGELNDAHEHVIDLRRQAEVLREIAAASDDYTAAAAEATRIGQLQEFVPAYARELKADLAQEELREQAAAVARATSAAEDAALRLEDARQAHRAADERRRATGGDRTAHSQDRVDEARRRLGDVRSQHERLASRLREAGIPVPAGREEFDELVASARRELAAPPPAATPYELHDRAADARRRIKALNDERTAIERRRSNIAGGLLRVREELVRRIGVSEAELPFAGELVEVREQHAAWTGAIERVLAPLSTALLVRDDILAEVRRTVDGWHLGVDLTIDAVPLESDPPPPSRDARSVVHRVHVADGPFASYLHRRLATDFDYACVDHPDELADVERGVTVAGLLKRGRRRYVKQDRHPVGDRARWMLGGDNTKKREELRDRLRQAQAELDAATAEVDAAGAERDRATTRRTTFALVVDTPWPSIDVTAAQHALDARERELRELVPPGSDLSRAIEEEREAQSEVDRRQRAANDAAGARTTAENERDRVQRSLDELTASAGDEIPEPIRSELAGRFRRDRRALRMDAVDGTATAVLQALIHERQTTDARVQAAASRFADAAARYRAGWPAVSADLTNQIGDRDGYRLLLESITARGLPEHEANFRRLLRERSRDTIIYLRDELRGALRRVEERIAPINESLGRSEFDRDRYLRIRPKLRQSDEVKDFLADLGTIVDGTWADETMESAERRFEILARVMRQLDRRNSDNRAWRARVLDTREHVSFLAQERDRAGTVISVHDSSAGLSGGQRQKLVVFCLAAALRYQLADPDDPEPRYGSIVLDEAFDKADAAYTRMAMNVFLEFGFHLILATPLKLLQTLEPYIGAVTSVSNPTRKASQLANVLIEQDR